MHAILPILPRQLESQTVDHRFCEASHIYQFHTLAIVCMRVVHSGTGEDWSQYTQGIHLVHVAVRFALFFCLSLVLWNFNRFSHQLSSGPAPLTFLSLSLSLSLLPLSLVISYTFLSFSIPFSPSHSLCLSQSLSRCGPLGHPTPPPR